MMIKRMHCLCACLTTVATLSLTVAVQAETNWSVTDGTTRVAFHESMLAKHGVEVSRIQQGMATAADTNGALLVRDSSTMHLQSDGGLLKGATSGWIEHDGSIVLTAHGRQVTLDGFVLRAARDGYSLFVTAAAGRDDTAMLTIRENKIGFDQVARAYRVESGSVRATQALADALGAPELANEVVGEIQTIIGLNWLDGDLNFDSVQPEDGSPFRVFPTDCNASTGADVIVGDLPNVSNTTAEQINSVWYDSFGIGTTSCNIGTEELLWIASTNEHPVIGQNFYRLQNGRFEQLGQAWLKHGFTALQQNVCSCGCQSSGTGARLGIGCSDPYSSGLNFGQSSAGPKWQVNAYTGAFTYPPADPSYSGTVARRMHIPTAELIDSDDAGAPLYFGDGQYVTPDDAAAGNANNNKSYRQIQVDGSGNEWDFGIFSGSSTQREEAGLRAWQDTDSSVVETDVLVPGEGLYIVASKATDVGGGVYEYEYAVQNVTSDRSMGSFFVPVDSTANITNIGFHDVAYFDGDGLPDPNNGDPRNFDGTDWNATVDSSGITWTVVATNFPCDPNNAAHDCNDNALRWGNVYNFRFRADSIPEGSAALLGMYKVGSPNSVSGVIVGPDAGFQDCNDNGVDDSDDLTSGEFLDCNLNGFLDVCESLVDEPITRIGIADGFASPVYVTQAPGDDTRLFVVEQDGLIKIIDLANNNAVLGTPFLDVTSLTGLSGERGLLGLAFHPNYQSNGKFYINYTNVSGNTVIAEYSVSGNPNIANATADAILATIPQDFSNHNGGCLQFGPDGMLYVGMGDGGSGNDPNNNAQNDNELLGKMLRYDVDNPGGGYIPSDNPGTFGQDEIWAKGLRNPWRFSFDLLTGDLYIGDVGQDAREEIDFQPASSTGGENYGWRCQEGLLCTGLSGCTCPDAATVDPIIDHAHPTAGSITGGYVYRGCAMPGLNGTYFYADFVTSFIKTLRYDGATVSDTQDRTAQLGNLTSIASFGEDNDGELYIVTYGGGIYKIVPDFGPICGDGVVEGSEQCDDGFLNNGDGCDEFCMVETECGNGVHEPLGGEECDDGNLINGDGCDQFCQIESADDCQFASQIFDGLTAIDTTEASTDGPVHAGCQFDGQTYNDIWFYYIPECSGDLTITTCGIGGYDTDIVFYSAFDCAEASLLANIIDCNDDGCPGTGSASYRSELIVSVTAGQTYLLRVGGYGSTSSGSGEISLTNSVQTCAGNEISGIVRDAATLQPIEGAMVTLQTTTTTTTSAADGTWSLPIASGTNLVIVAAKVGYFYGSVTIDAPASGVDILMDAVPQDNDPTYEFKTANECGACHPDQRSEWENSRMGNTGLNQWVYDLYNGTATAGGMNGFVYTRDSQFALTHPEGECASCHQPERWVKTPHVALEDFSNPSANAMHGISCEICHKMADVDETMLNFPGVYPGTFTMTLPQGPNYHQVQYGVLGDVSYEAPTVMRASFQPEIMAEMCGMCHYDRSDLQQDQQFDDVVADPTFLEWANSPYGDPQSKMYADCVDCHMPPTGATNACTLISLARDPNTIREHDIQGTTPLYLENAVDLVLQANQVGDEIQVQIDITNTQAGHHVPTGVNIRNMVLLVEAKRTSDDSDLLYTGSQTVHELGGVGDPAQGYYAGLPGKLFAKVSEDSGGTFPVLFTESVGELFDTRIPALATDSSSYAFAVPATGGDVEISARLIYRRAFRALIDTKGWTNDGQGNALADLQAPDFGHLMESASAVINVPSGACCAPDGTCSETTESGCAAATNFVCDVAAYLPGTFAGCLGDVDGSGVVNASDRGFISANIGQTGDIEVCTYDLDGSGVINASDRGIISANIGLCEPLPDFQNGSGLNHGSPDNRFGGSVPGTWYGLASDCGSIDCNAGLPNDDCGDAQAVTEGAPAATGNSVGATNDDSASCDASTDGDVWFAYTATCTGEATVEAVSTGGIEPVVAVFDACGGSELACDAGTATDALATLSVSAGTTYQIRVAGSNASSGTFDLNIECAPSGACCDPSDGSCIDDLTQADCQAAGGNWAGADTDCATTVCATSNDDCDGAFPAFDGDNAYDTTDATLDGSVVAPSDGNMTEDVWFYYTSTCAGTLRFDTCEGTTGADTVLEIYEGCDCSTMVSVGDGDDDGCGVNGFSSIVENIDSPTAGTCFTIRLSGWNGAEISGLLAIACTPAAASGACCNPDGSCTDAVADQATCEAGGGIWNGAGSDCASSDCTGACCNTDGTCTDAVADQAICEAGGGTWNGAGSDCASSTCVGACCESDGTCTDGVEDQAACEAGGGIWEGLASDCGSVSCPQPAGDACGAETVVVMDSGAQTFADHGGFFTFTATSAATHVELCGTDFDTVMSITDDAGTCTNEVAANDDCNTSASYGVGSDTTASCYDTGTAERDSCTCFATVPGQDYTIHVVQYSGSAPPATNSITVTLTSDTACP